MQLIDYLKKEGISQAKFARKIKMSPAGVCRIIKGNRFPRPETILAIDFWTQGQVTHDDFYKQAQAQQQSDVSQV
jgi:transcriptional regulator with XRE-family HTH domain